MSFFLATQNPLTLTEDKLKFPELCLHGSSPDPSKWSLSIKWVLFYSPVSWLLVFSNSKSSSVIYPPFLIQTGGWSDLLTSVSRSLNPTSIGQRACHLVLGLCRSMLSADCMCLLLFIESGLGPSINCLVPGFQKDLLKLWVYGMIFQNSWGRGG